MILKEKFTVPAGIGWFILTGTQTSFSGWLLGRGPGLGGSEISIAFSHGGLEDTEPIIGEWGQTGGGNGE